jgi:hypothetical protein
LLGIIIDEHTFPVGDDVNDLLVDAVGKSVLMQMQGNKDIVSYIPTGEIPVIDMMKNKKVQESSVAEIATIEDLSEHLVPSVVSVGEVQPPKASEEEIQSFHAICESTLASSPIMKMKALSPNLFDRVFLLPIDPDHFEIDVAESVKSMGGKEAFDKEMSELTETIMTPDGNEVLRLKPRPKSENYSTMHSIFISVSSVTEEED